MVASPKPSPPDSPDGSPDPTETYKAAARAFLEVARESGFGGGNPPSEPPDPAKAVHNEITKLKATTLNSVALAFFIGGGVAPLIGWAATGFSFLQAFLGLVWVFAGFVLHHIARGVLKGLVP